MLHWRRGSKRKKIGSFVGDGCYGRDGGAALERVFAREAWKAIPRCDGRYVLRTKANPGLGDLVANEKVVSVRLREATPERDGVAVGYFLSGGGLVTYEKWSGRLAHTLGTASGVVRKLDALDLADTFLEHLRQQSERAALLFDVLHRVLRCLPDPEKTRVAPAVSAAIRANIAATALRNNQYS